jgi:hypothetical protein
VHFSTSTFSTGWPDLATFRLHNGQKLCIYFVKKWFGLYFGRFFKQTHLVTLIFNILSNFVHVRIQSFFPIHQHILQALLTNIHLCVTLEESLEYPRFHKSFFLSWLLDFLFTQDTSRKTKTTLVNLIILKSLHDVKVVKNLFYKC